MANFIINRLKGIVLFVIGLFRRALCCFRRRRRPSCETVTLTAVGSIADLERPTEQQWNTWEEPSTLSVQSSHKNIIQEKIDMYRNQRSYSQNEEDQPQINYFVDMTPKITRQKKVLLDQKSTDINNKSNTSIFNHDPVYNSSELENWEDGHGWEDQTQPDWDVDAELREKKRIDREKKLAQQQFKKLEKEYQTKKHLISVRMS